MARPTDGRQRRGGKKNRKHGRWSRKPSHKRYVAERRWIKNKARRIKKYMKAHPSWNPGNLNPEVARLL